MIKVKYKYIYDQDEDPTPEPEDTDSIRKKVKYTKILQVEDDWEDEK
jgi:hypothetical protein